MRKITHRTAGRQHGPIRRLISPSDLGQVPKPFVFVDLFMLGGGQSNGSSNHPHSGIATLTYTLSGDAAYEDATGKQGVLKAGGVEWIQAGGEGSAAIAAGGRAPSRDSRMPRPGRLETAPASPQQARCDLHHVTTFNPPKGA